MPPFPHAEQLLLIVMHEFSHFTLHVTRFFVLIVIMNNPAYPLCIFHFPLPFTRLQHLLLSFQLFTGQQGREEKRREEKRREEKRREEKRREEKRREEKRREEKRREEKRRKKRREEKRREEKRREEKRERKREREREKRAQDVDTQVPRFRNDIEPKRARWKFLELRTTSRVSVVLQLCKNAQTASTSCSSSQPRQICFCCGRRGMGRGSAKDDPRTLILRHLATWRQSTLSSVPLTVVAPSQSDSSTLAAFWVVNESLHEQQKRPRGFLRGAIVPFVRAKTSCVPCWPK